MDYKDIEGIVRRNDRAYYRIHGHISSIAHWAFQNQNNTDIILPYHYYYSYTVSWIDGLTMSTTINSDLFNEKASVSYSKIVLRLHRITVSPPTAWFLPKKFCQFFSNIALAERSNDILASSRQHLNYQIEQQRCQDTVFIVPGNLDVW